MVNIVLKQIEGYYLTILVLLFRTIPAHKSPIVLSTLLHIPSFKSHIEKNLKQVNKQVYIKILSNDAQLVHSVAVKLYNILGRNKRRICCPSNNLYLLPCIYLYLLTPNVNYS